MKELIDLIEDSKIDEIINDSNELLYQKSLLGYNIFTISSYNTQLENYHSDIIASILNPKGLHNEGDIFLKEFINYLNNELGFQIKNSDFNDAEVHREKGRLDILIYDKNSKSAIIFENKINDAPDMDEQLNRYYDWCSQYKLKVLAVLYVTLRGLKNAPPVKDDLNGLLKNVAVFSKSQSDIVNGWLTSCIEKCTSTHSSSLLIQYCKLLTYLGFDSMEKSVMDDFYKVANQNGFLNKVKKINNLTNEIPTYRTDNLQASIVDYAPFNNSFRYKTNYMLYDNFFENDNKFKLDIEFKDDGTAWIGFWNPQRQNDEGNLAVSNKIKQISFQDRMIQDGGWYIKKFEMSEYQNMIAIDNAIINFTKEFLLALKNSIKSK